MSDAASAIRFYFSFRSPYAWIAAERLEAELGDLGVPIERIPVFPTPGHFPNDPTALPDKAAHIVQDVPRLARERGLSVRFPSANDTDWALPHAAFLEARSRDGGQRFMVEVFRKRFCEGLDVGEDEVVADAARRAGLDPDAILSAGHSEDLRARASEGWRVAAERDRVFGVPSFVFADRLYWGQDRMHFVRSAVLRKAAPPARAPARAEDGGPAAFPERIRALPPFDGPFDAFRLAAEGCEVLFACYPAGTAIAPHTHDTENCGVVTRGELVLLTDGVERRLGPGEWYHLAAGQEHAARFEVETSEIEFWFAR